MNSTRFWTSSLLSAALFGLFDRPLIAQQKQPAEPPVAVVPNLDLLSPAAARREAFVSQRVNRLQAHSVVLLDWINLSADLSEQQKLQLNATLSTATTQAQAAWTGEGAKSTNTDYLLPINFTSPAAPSLNYTAPRPKLSPTMKRCRLNKPENCRKRSRNEKTIIVRQRWAMSLSLLDDVFFLTPAQRKQMRSIAAKKVDLEGPRSSPQSSYQKAILTRFVTTGLPLAMLDRELWLDSSQREQLLKSILRTLPAVDAATNERQDIVSLSLLCIPLCKLSQLDLTILSPAQRAVWKGMKDLFTLNNNYARVKTKRRGTISIRLPDSVVSHFPARHCLPVAKRFNVCCHIDKHVS